MSIYQLDMYYEVGKSIIEINKTRVDIYHRQYDFNINLVIRSTILFICSLYVDCNHTITLLFVNLIQITAIKYVL